MPQVEDNVRAVQITQELFTQMITTGWEGHARCVLGIPPDAEFVKAEIEPTTGDAQYIFRHPSFPGVLWDEMQLQEIVFERVEDAVPVDLIRDLYKYWRGADNHAPDEPEFAVGAWLDSLDGDR